MVYVFWTPFYSQFSNFTISGNIRKNFLSLRCIRVSLGGASRWRKSEMRRSPSSPQIHQKYIYMWNNSYRSPTERWQKTSDLPEGKKLPTYLGREKEKRETKE